MSSGMGSRGIVRGRRRGAGESETMIAHVFDYIYCIANLTLADDCCATRTYHGFMMDKEMNITVPG